MLNIYITCVEEGNAWSSSDRSCARARMYMCMYIRTCMRTTFICEREMKRVRNLYMFDYIKVAM